MQTKKSFSLFIILPLISATLFGQTHNDSIALNKINNVAKDNSAITEIVTNLSDINGPRLR